MNSNENDIPNMRSSGGTEIKQGQTDTMINTINASQSRLNSLEEQKKQ